MHSPGLYLYHQLKKKGMVVARRGREMRMGSYCLMGIKFSFTWLGVYLIGTVLV